MEPWVIIIECSDWMDLAVLVDVLIFKLSLQNCIDLWVFTSLLVYVDVELTFKSFFAWSGSSSLDLQQSVVFYLSVNRMANAFVHVWLRLHVTQHLLLLGPAGDWLLEVLIIIFELHYFLILSILLVSLHHKLRIQQLLSQIEIALKLFNHILIFLSNILIHLLFLFSFLKQYFLFYQFFISVIPLASQPIFHLWYEFFKFIWSKINGIYFINCFLLALIFFRFQVRPFIHVLTWVLYSCFFVHYLAKHRSVSSSVGFYFYQRIRQLGLAVEKVLPWDMRQWLANVVLGQVCQLSRRDCVVLKFLLFELLFLYFLRNSLF